MFNVAISNNMAWQLRKIIKSRDKLQDIGGWNAVMHNMVSISLKRISKWNIACSITCKLCDAEDESVQHLFFKCAYAAVVWQEIHDKRNLNYHVLPFCEEVRKAKMKAHGKSRQVMLYVMLFTKIIYFVWLQRNNKIFNDVLVPPQVLVEEIIFRVSCYCKDEE